MSAPSYRPEENTYGLPLGTVRGFLSLLICSFFWLFLLLPDPMSGAPAKAPLGHFFLLTLVFLAFASHPIQELTPRHVLPWLMRVVFVGGTVAVVLFVAATHPDRLSDRLTPAKDDIAQWPVLLGCLAGGFAVALLVRTVLGRHNEFFQTFRAWIGVIAVLLLLFETLFQFAIRPNISPVSQDALKVWEGILIAAVAAYFGSRA
ncbi:MAG: hypothetical protein C0501_09870 [Isosphaera sp.]|nr:hypothetical protein [Isosphaera sp.]